jgi:hypothetical protein
MAELTIEHLAKGCQFGNHGEPFLWHGSGSDEVDIAIMQLFNLATDDPEQAHEACEFVAACVKDSRRTLLAPDKGQAVEISSTGEAIAPCG